MKKFKLLTHNDLDGVGCFIVAKLLLKNVDVEYCSISTIEDKLSTTLLALDKYEHVYITDIAVSQEYVDQFFTPEVVRKVSIIDHHYTNLPLNQYGFAHIHVELDDILTSGTHLFHNHLINEGYQTKSRDIDKKLREFVELVRSYDTWDWFEAHNLLAKDVNDLLYIKSIKYFVKDMLHAIKNNEPFLSQTDNTLLSYERIRIERYINQKEKDIIPLTILGHSIGIIFAESYVSEVCNELARKHQEYDVIAAIGNKNVSYRTIKDVDVSQIAKEFGGGGQLKAAGNLITDKQREEYIQSIFKS